MNLLQAPVVTKLICLHLGFKNTEELKQSKFYVYVNDGWHLFSVNDSYDWIAKVDEGYKICLTCLDKESYSRTFYQTDFLSLLEEDFVVLFKNQKIKRIKAKVPFVNGLYIVHEFEVLSEE